MMRSKRAILWGIGITLALITTEMPWRNTDVAYGDILTPETVQASVRTAFLQNDAFQMLASGLPADINTGVSIKAVPGGYMCIDPDECLYSSHLGTFYRDMRTEKTYAVEENGILRDATELESIQLSVNTWLHAGVDTRGQKLMGADFIRGLLYGCANGEWNPCGLDCLTRQGEPMDDDDHHDHDDYVIPYKGEIDLPDEPDPGEIILNQ